MRNSGGLKGPGGALSRTELALRLFRASLAIVDVGQDEVTQRRHRRLGAELDALRGQLVSFVENAGVEIELRQVKMAYREFPVDLDRRLPVA